MLCQRPGAQTWAAWRLLGGGALLRDALQRLTHCAQYFVSSGFAFIHGDSSTDVCAVEAVPLETLDHEAVKQGLADYQAKLINAKDDYEKAAAQVGIEVCSAMNSALGG